MSADITASQDLSAGTGTALSYTTTIARNRKLEQVIFHASVGITETVTVEIVSAEGANYSVVLDSHAMAGTQDYVFRPTGECNIKAGDAIKVTCTAANDTGTIYILIKTSEM